ncbi:hypothetical protein HZC30_06840, partial [Candidatus Woesearchaeota archaeon]|nr:hypothetical protein [Candidatus Woesearchaeota archaeon]
MAKETPRKKEAPEEMAKIIAEPIEVKEKLEGIEEVQAKESDWKPVTDVGKKVKSGEISDIEQLFNQGY